MKNRVRNLAMLIFLGGSLVLTSCRDNKNNDEDTNHEMNSEDHMDHDNMMDDDSNDSAMMGTTAKFKDDQITAVYKHYTEIQDALASDDPQGTKDHAKMMVMALSQGEKGDDMLEPTKRIANSDDINVQREAFSDLTSKMGAALDGAIADGEVYKLYCPMAFEGKGDYWYANSKEIKNPYFGSKMLNCGRVEETIQ